MAQGELRSFPGTGLTVGTNASVPVWSEFYGNLRKPPENYGKRIFNTSPTIR
jgi:hypothetical protein